jgi:hypothetical protein
VAPLLAHATSLRGSPAPSLAPAPPLPTAGPGGGRSAPPPVPPQASAAAHEQATDSDSVFIVEEVRDITPPPERLPGRASESEISDLPVSVMPRIYERPARKRKADGEEKKRRRALDAEGRRRKLTLPGMPPTRR